MKISDEEKKKRRSIAQEAHKRGWFKEGKYYINLIRDTDKKLAIEADKLIEEACSSNMTFELGCKEVKRISEKIRKKNPGLSIFINRWIDKGASITCDGE